MSIFTYLKKHTVLATTITIVAVIIMIIGGRMAGKSSSLSSTTNIKSVELIEATNFRGDVSIVSADGVVESVSQVDLKSQLSAPISRLTVSVGDTVGVGQTIAELQNADIRAQLDQARASLSLAQGQYETGAVSVDSARKSAVDKMKDAYQKADDVINAQIDQLIFNRSTGAAQLSVLIIDFRIQNTIINKGSNVEISLKNWKSVIDNLSDISTNKEIADALVISQKSLDSVAELLNDTALALNDAAKSAISTSISQIISWKTVVTGARSSISAASASITTAESVLASAQSTNETPATAQISVAQAGVKNLEAQLAKTVIRSPISGKVASLPLREGELATPGQLVATVVGSGGFQVKAYASGEDFSRIKKDAKVMIQGKIPGVVVSVAPSVNQVNKKIEVKVLVNDSQSSGLVVGQSVQAAIQADATKNTAESTVYRLPIQNVKIVPGNAYVLTIDENSKIKMNPVILGEVRGDFVEIKSGITNEMKIVSPVYELNEGESVNVQ